MTMPPLPNPILRDDTEHGRKYCTLADAVAYGKACAAAATERAALLCEGMSALDAMDGEEYGSAAMVRVADRQAALCAAAIRGQS
jgi:hypothetical protein